jgi:uncharacterized protein (TIGR00645 family)
MKIQDILENLIESFLFKSRWILAPLYVGLSAILAILSIKFIQELIHIIPNILNVNGTQLIVEILGLVDIVLIANLLLIIIFSGYENFISRIDAVKDHVDRPEWMGTVDYGALKLKVIGSVAAISTIELLRIFITIKNENIVPDGILWMVIIHSVFVLSGVLFALMEKISHKDKHKNST